MLNPNKIQRFLYIFLYFINLSFCIIKVRDTDNHLIVGRFSDVESDFGGEFMDEETAYLIISNPILACNSTIVPPPFEPQNGSNIIFVSLIKRGFCTFENKVRSAQTSGYHGVIVYNIDDYIFPMKKSDNSDENPILIPSRMVTYSSGIQLMKFNYSSSNNQFVVIFFKDFEFNPQYYIIAFLGFVSLGFLLIGIGFTIKLCRDCVKKRANRLKKCHLNKIPIKKFVKGEDLYDTCAICLEDFVNGEKLRILPCNHAYHLKCIDPWLLKQKRNCPICKNRIKIEGRDEDSDDNSAAAPSESSNVVIDEHTPLINPRNDGPTSFFTFNENENTFSPERTGTLAQNYYENLCIDDNVAATPVEQSKDSVAQTHSINYGDDVEIIIGDTASNKTKGHDHAEDLNKKV